MTRAGLRFDSHFLNDADFAGSPGYTGAIRVRDSDQRLMASLVDWLFEQPWCGMVFTAGGGGIEGAIPGTFSRSLVMTDHERAPEIYYIMRNDDARDANGIVGGCYFDGEYPEGGSTHGGLHPKELNNVLMVQGSLFRQTYCSDYPAGIIDVAPTVLHLLGFPQPVGMSGRVLREALNGSSPEPQEPVRLECTAGTQRRCQHLKFSRVGSTTYLDAGWVE